MRDALRWAYGLFLCAVLLAAGCAPQPLQVTLTPVEGGLDIRADRPLDRVELFDAAGVRTVIRRLPTPSTAVHLPTSTAGRHVRVVARSGSERASIEADLPSLGSLAVAVEAPLGQGSTPVVDGGEIALVLVGEEAVTVGVLLTALAPVTAVVFIDDVRSEVSLPVVGERRLLDFEVRGERPRRVRIEAGDRVLTAVLRPRLLPVDTARRQLPVVGVSLPTDPFGAVDRARPTDRIALPAPWWRATLRRLGLGYRPRDDQAPWCWQAVTLDNRGDRDLNLLLRARIVDDTGAPAAGFQSRVRGGKRDEVRALLRVPAGRSATATLPVFVDGGHLTQGQQYTRIIEVLPLGSAVALHRIERPLYVSEGSFWASAGFVLALCASLAGYLLLLSRGGGWLAAARTSDLVTIALFGSLTFVVATAFQVLGMGIASVLGPFAPLLMGLPDDAFRACLLGTLVTLLPRPGVVGLATVVGFLMRGLALGAFHPVDLLYVGSAVFWLESWLWVAGLTRGTAWPDAPRISRWIRLVVGFGGANLCAMATGLVISVVLYRLFFAGWYIGLILALPGFLYVAVGCWLAVDFADSLRRVAT